MSVLKCDKRGCTNIMCDTYIPNIGYICDDCKDEFETYMDDKPKTNLKQELEIFMDIEIGSHSIKIHEDVKTFFRSFNQ